MITATAAPTTTELRMMIRALPAAYSLARLTGRWGEHAGILMFIVYLVPPTLLFIPLFGIIVALGLSNSLQPGR